MAKIKKVASKHTCKDCRHSYSPHCKDSKGVEFLCKCPFHEWSKFLNYSWCEKFEQDDSSRIHSSRLPYHG